MNPSLYIFQAFLIIQSFCTEIVNEKCRSCSDMKSQADCSDFGGCTWTVQTITGNGQCILASKTISKLTGYCPGLSDQKQCSQTYGCAYLDGQCTNFAGCSAYVRNTDKACLEISYRCVSDGTMCNDAYACELQPVSRCATTQDLNGRKCTIDQYTKLCRNYTCAEADITYITDKACDSFSAGCVTTGLGCIISPLPICAQLTGTKETCPLMIGSDGKCKFHQGTNCDVKLCTDASLSIQKDIDCQAFQFGCVTTGKGCVSQLNPCSFYKVMDATIECEGYIGSDGICEEDPGFSKCRSRICENLNGTTDTQCSSYKEGCITNGKKCVTILGRCQDYTGNINDCTGIIGSDGNCTGQSDTQQGACRLMNCVQDSTDIFTTDQQCQTIQWNCVTNGAGCNQRLPSCTTYKAVQFDGSDCFNRVGFEGNCKYSGSGNYCTTRICEEAPQEYYSTQGCSKYRKGCIYSGINCVTQVDCANTATQTACKATIENTNSCQWTSNCANINDSNPFQTQAQCLTNSITKTYVDIQMKINYTWSNNECRLAICSDYTGDNYKTDEQCNNILAGCVTNGIGCADPKDCSQFQGNMTKCQEYKAYCTNIDDTLTLQTPCIARSCENARGMRDNNDCNSFLTGCIYDLNGSCLESNAKCSEFRIPNGQESICLGITGYTQSVKHKCWYDNNDHCRDRICSDYANYSDKKVSPTDIDCDIFLSGCLSKGDGCLAPTEPCTAYNGNINQCSKFVGNYIQCTKVDECKEKQCSDKTGVSNNSDCLLYHSKCRLAAYGATYCDEAKVGCYHDQFPRQYWNYSISEKLAFCEGITDLYGTLCTYRDSTTVAGCVARMCESWQFGLSKDKCQDYTGPNQCYIYENKCFQIKSSCVYYMVPSSINDQKGRLAYCQNLKNSLGQQCKESNKTPYTCVDSYECETAQPTSSADVNSQIDRVDCQCQITTNNSIYCYKTPTLCTYDSQLKICQTQLADDSQGLVTACQLIGNQCKAILCDSAVNPTNQESCDKISKGCKFYSGKCYQIKKCAEYAILAGINDTENKRLFCQNMYQSNSTNYCSYIDSQSNCFDPLYDCTQIAYQSTSDCGKFRLGTGQACHFTDGNNTCDAPVADQCIAVQGIDTTESCDLYTSIGFCKNNGGNCQLKDPCTSYNYSSSNTKSEQNAVDCQQYSNSKGEYCSWKIAGTGTECDIAPMTCDEWDSLIPTDDNTLFCSKRIDRYGNICTYDVGVGATTCRTAVPCEFVTSPGFQAQCNKESSGCIYYNQKCIPKKINCNTQLAVGSNDTEKQKYCNHLKTTSDEGCTYWNNEQTCRKIDACSSYQVSTPTDLSILCTVMINSNGVLCFGETNATACQQFDNCEAIKGVNGQGDCDKYIVGCVYNQNKCYTKAENCGFTIQGQKSISLCSGFINSQDGSACTAVSDSASQCQPRQCSDKITPQPTNNSDCAKYKSSCKFDGQKCINGNATCSNYSESYCSVGLDVDNKSTCQSPPQNCVSSDICNQKVNDVGGETCKKLAKNCISAGGYGCVLQTATCSQIWGTNGTCSQVTLSDGRCQGLIDGQIGSCWATKCQDNTKATTNEECDKFKTGCLTTKPGCIAPSEPCSAYKGTFDTCKQFTGSNGNQKCWGQSSTILSSCKEKECSDLHSASDADCDSFIPSQDSNKINCVSNGKNCVSSQSLCKDFIGNTDTCQIFKAFDGPCKSTSITGEVVCAQRVCNEAPTNYTTDDECQNYHSTCVTTGKGCMQKTKFACKFVQTQNACSANIDCAWFELCRTPPPSCNQMTSSGSSICVNTQLSSGKHCIWSDDVCREYTCYDYDSTFNTHQACYDQDKKCTTNGQGCVPYSTCSTYTNSSVCFAAQTIQKSVYCTWDIFSKQCRQRQCTDNTTFTFDADCNTFLAGCKTNGSGCIESTYTCDVFNGHQTHCLQDSSGNPCLYVDGICYKYAQCTDAIAFTLSDCQKFNPLCVPSISSCIPQNSCDKYTSNIECILGINNTICGWLPSGKCQIFGICEDAIGGNNDFLCSQYGLSCLSDGKNCITKGICSSYLTQQACTSPIGAIDGQCTWVLSGTSGKCRLAICTDKIATTDAECATFNVTSGICTTNGTSCIDRQKCTSYAVTDTNQKACNIGSDGIQCIYSFPLAQTTGIKGCRPKECADVIGITNEQCIGQVIGKKCISNGKNCIQQDKCSSYINKISCNGGGSDGICAFSPAPTKTDTLAGTCTLFNKCQIAKNDQTACISNPSCQFNNSTVGNTTILTCVTKTCQLQNVNTCNNIPSFDAKQLTICTVQNGACKAIDPSQLISSTCYKSSAYTYTWSEKKQQCVSCTTSNATENTTQENPQSETIKNNQNSKDYILVGVITIIVIQGAFS